MFKEPKFQITDLELLTISAEESSVLCIFLFIYFAPESKCTVTALLPPDIMSHLECYVVCVRATAVETGQKNKQTNK